MSVQAAVDYDVVYARSPRAGDDQLIKIPEVLNPIEVPPGTDLMLLRADGSEDVLVPGGNGAVVDPYVSFDGLWVYYAKFHDQRPEMLDRQRRGNPSKAGADIFKINIQTREIIQLTTQEWTPNTGLIDWSSDHLNADENGAYHLGYGIFNLGPCPLPDGRVMFTSSRNSYLPNKKFTAPNLQLFVMNNDGSDVELIGHLNLGSALHPTILTDGRVMFSSYEGQGIRDIRLWGLWGIWPDGRGWEPLMSALQLPSALHFQTQLSNGDIAVAEYYNGNNSGFGTILAFPSKPPVGRPAFGSPFPDDPSNPKIQRGIWWFDDEHSNHKKPRYERYGFSPAGLYTLTKFAHASDTRSSRNQEGGWAGKVTHPCGAPDNDVLMAWSPGPANHQIVIKPFYDSGIYVLKKGVPTDDEKDLVLLKNDPDYHEFQPRPVVTYEAIYGIKQPASIPWYRNDGSEHEDLQSGTPYGIVGTSSFYKRDSFPGTGPASFDGLDAFNTSVNEVSASKNWRSQGADAGKYDNSEIHAVRILSMEPTTHVGRGPGIGNGAVRGFHNHATERLRILGELPLRKFNNDGTPILDSEGNPDTSFLAKIPSDVPFTFQTLDKDGIALNMSQTWHQLRPGELRNNCGGCHGHSQEPLAFEGTYASSDLYQLADFIHMTPLLSKDQDGQPAVTEHSERATDIEYHRDIKPILMRSCVSCHSKNGQQEAGLALDDESIVDGYENTYNRLARDEFAKYGIAPVSRNGKWNYPNASRYVRKFQARRSLLVWKIFGRRMDGWNNTDHPTESVLGDASTLPTGVHPNDADIDYIGTIMPPPDSGVPPLSEDEKMMIARWVDLGCPITQKDGPVPQLGWFADDLRPTIDLSIPSRKPSTEPLDKIQIGIFDYYSGLDFTSISVTADFMVNGNESGSELFPFFNSAGDHVWSLQVDPPIPFIDGKILTVRAKDQSGNWNEVKRAVSIRPSRRPLVLRAHKAAAPDKVSLLLEGERATQGIIEASSNLMHWQEIGQFLDFDGSQQFLEEQFEDIRFYRAKTEEE